MSSVGEKLRQAREARRMSLDELQQITKIQKRYLEAMEEDRFDTMPGTFYVRAFIKQYANAVGLDSEELLDQLDGKPRKTVTPEPAPVYEEVHESRKNLHEESKTWTNKLPIVLLSLIAISIIAVVFWLTWEDRQSSPLITEPSSVSVEGSVASSSQSQTETTASTTVETTQSSEKPAPPKMSFDLADPVVGANNSASTEIVVKDSQDPITVTFASVDGGRCWVGVYVDEATVFDKTIESGETTDVKLPKGAKDVRIRIGYAPSVSVQLNKEKLAFNPDNLGATLWDLHFSIAYAKA